MIGLNILLLLDVRIQYLLFLQKTEDGDVDRQLLSMSSEDIKELFNLCDVNNSGYIEKSELKNIVPNADCMTLEKLLEELDTDGDGRISLEELEKGLYKLTTGTIHALGSDSNNNKVSPTEIVDDCEQNSMERR